MADPMGFTTAEAQAQPHDPARDASAPNPKFATQDAARSMANFGFKRGTRII